MNLCLMKALSRCAVFKLENDSCFYAPEPYCVTLNGQDCGMYTTNCFTLFALQPDSLYEVCVKSEQGDASVFFHTAEESAYLPVTRFGAIGDGTTDCTSALQAAISSCPAGGTVYIPEGIYYTYPLFLKSDITVYLDKNAELRGGTMQKKYPILPGMLPDAAYQQEWNFGTWEGNPLSCYASLLTGIHVHNVVICGEGTLNGNAESAAWWQDVKTSRPVWRPRTVFLNRCTQISLVGLTVSSSPSWTIHPYYCDTVDILNLTVRNPDNSPNTDGIDVESCADVRIVGCMVSVGDDCIVIKSGKYYMAQYHLKPSRNVTIFNCCLERGHGGVVVGSEVSGGVNGLTITQCLMRNTDRGLRIKTRRGRGKNSILTHIQCKKMHMIDVKAAFVINMFYFCDPDGKSEYVSSKLPQPDDGRTPKVGSITLQDIRCEQCSMAGIYFYGLPEAPIEQVKLSDIYIDFKPEAEADLPAMMDGIEPVKKLGIFAANVTLLQAHNVKVMGYEGERCQLSGVEKMEEI